MADGEFSPSTATSGFPTVGGMPTAAEFRATADALDALGRTSGSAQSTIGTARADTGIRGGDFAAAIDRGLDVAGLNLGTVMGLCSDGATEARRRALVCDEYTLAYRRYQQRLGEWSSRDPELPAVHPPQPPARPATWADVG